MGMSRMGAKDGELIESVGQMVGKFTGELYQARNVGKASDGIFRVVGSDRTRGLRGVLAWSGDDHLGIDRGGFAFPRA
jgi:hypothetical protein